GSRLLEAFPPAIRFRVGPDGHLTDERTEPLAADVRKGKDQKRDAKLKLVAGILGIRFDDLKRRDARRRRQRRLTVSAATILVLLVIFGVWGREAAKAESRRLALLSSRVQEDDPELAILIGSLGVAKLWPWGHSVLPEAEQQLHRAILASRVRFAVMGQKDSPVLVALNPSGTQLATGRSDGRVVIQDVATARVLWSRTGLNGPVSSLAWHPDGRHLAVGTHKSAISILDVS